MLRALRISFVRSDNSIEVKSAALVNKRAPASSATEADLSGSGFWLELRDGPRTVYRRLVSAQFERDAEVFGGGPGEPFKRVSLARASEVDVAVPLPEGRDFRELRLVIVERKRGAGRAESATARKTRAYNGHDEEHVDVALGDLVRTPEGEM